MPGPPAYALNVVRRLFNVIMSV